MLLRFLLIAIFSFSGLNAVNLYTSVGDKIVVNYSGMKAKNRDWIGVYKKEDSNEWKNVIRWAWTGDKESGKIVFKTINTSGTYETRAFYNNSYTTVAKYEFKITAQNVTLEFLHGVNDRPNGDMYLKASKSVGASWVGIYKSGASNAWENVLLWSWVDANNWIAFKKDKYRKALKFNKNYEARLFFNNSFHKEASLKFKLSKPVNINVTVGPTYHGDDFKGLTLDIPSGYYLIKTDWIAIYKKGSKNIIQWSYIKFDPNIRGYILKMPSNYKYKEGETYEAVLYENNTYRVITSSEFKGNN